MRSSLPSNKASMDVQYALSLAYNTTAMYYTTGGHGPVVSDADPPNQGPAADEPYLEQLHYLLGLPDEDLPAILSTSYGTHEQLVPVSYANQTCNMFAQLGARGVSVIFNNSTNKTRPLLVVLTTSTPKKPLVFQEVASQKSFHVRSTKTMLSASTLTN